MNVSERKRPTTFRGFPEIPLGQSKRQAEPVMRVNRQTGKIDSCITKVDAGNAIRRANTLRSLALSTGIHRNQAQTSVNQAFNHRLTTMFPLEPAAVSAERDHKIDSKLDLEREILLQCNCAPALIEFAQGRIAQTSMGLSEYLIEQGLLDPDVFYWGASGRLNLRFLDEGALSAIAPIDENLKPLTKAGLLFVPAQDLNRKLVYAAAPKGQELERFLYVLEYFKKEGLQVVLVTPQHQRSLTVTTYTANALASSSAAMSAVTRFFPGQIKFLTISPIVLLGVMGVAFETAIWCAFALLTLSLAGWGSLRLAAFFSYCAPRPLTPPQVQNWPTYTVLVPLYRESSICRQLVNALDALDYPKDALDIIFLVEQEDDLTQRNLRKLLRQSMRMIVMPRGKPQTKPRALSVGLAAAKGEYVTVFDAEDRPEPLQLKRALCQFALEGPETACLQGALSIDHADANWLVRQFAFEYAALFDVFLPFLARHNLLLPLGGTSNHFRASALREVGGWDPFNVTEDADLGVRFARYGYKTKTVVTSTYEEAPLTVKAWLHQRTRWHKGWIQTLVVHLRHPKLTYQQLGVKNFLLFLLLFGGGMLCLWGAPLTVAAGLSMTWIALTQGVEALGVFSLVTLLCFLFGFGGAVTSVLQGSAQRGFKPSLVELASIPVYWLLGSLASYKALVEFIINPHYWRKTEHGLVQGREGTRPNLNR